MRKILVPTDFSENAYNALKYGAKLFAKEECVFYLLYTYTPSLYNSEYLIYSSLSVDEIYRLNAAKSLSRIVRRIKKEIPNENHSFKKIASFSLLQDEIKNQVHTHDIELVIMGTQGTTGAAQILFGSHTIHTIKGAICPLLIIPSNFDFVEPKNILFPSDFESGITKENLKIILDIAEMYQSKIHFLHIFQEAELDPSQEEGKKLLKEHFKDTPHSFHKIKNQTVPQGIIDFQKKSNMDLLVMLKHKHSFFYNLFFRPVVNKIGFRLSSPFLVIPLLNKEVKS